MKTSDRFNTRIGELVDVYQGAVPLSRCILEATRQQPSLPLLSLERDEGGQIFLAVFFSDGSNVTLAVDEEFA